jgi:hypothetical protein
MFTREELMGLLPMPICVDEQSRMLSLHPFQGKRVISSGIDAIYYGFMLMELRIEQNYDVATPEVKARWEGETDDYVDHMATHYIPATDPERQLINEIQDALKLQRCREREEAHLVSGSILPIWLNVGLKAENYLFGK